MFDEATLARVALDGPGDPLPVARWLREDAHPVVLSGAWLEGGTILAGEPVEVLEPGADPLAALARHGAAGRFGAKAVGGGWLGFIGFAAGRRVERVPPGPPRPAALPEAALGFYDHVLRQDGEGRWWFEALRTPAREAALELRLTEWRRRLATPAPERAPGAGGRLRVTGAGVAGHAVAVAAARERIASGEIFQANLCLRLEADFAGDALEMWIRAATELRPAHAAYVAGPWGALASLSPERFLRRSGRNVRAEPIKGTARGDADPAVLAASVKDRAENVMIADLMRNDLGRVCEFGSVEVEELSSVRPGPGVWHLVSTVRGRLREGVDDEDLLRATFPPGSVTGAPKVQALRVIAELEATGREAYCGAIGIASPVAGLDLSVTIRTFEVAGGRIWLGAGGGVVADSSPEGEVREALTKAAPLAAAAGLRIDEPPRVEAEPPAVPYALDAGRERPDPALGLLETILVRDGEAPLLDPHLARLRASVTALGLPVPADLAELARAQAAALGDGRLRISLDAECCVTEGSGSPSPRDAVLRPWLLPGGLGAHKWADRRLIDALGADGTTPLFVDLDGSVLEAGYAALLLERDGVLHGPPLDGRILPSITRAQHEVVETRLTLDDLRSGRILLASALRGLHPATLTR